MTRRFFLSLIGALAALPIFATRLRPKNEQRPACVFCGKPASGEHSLVCDNCPSEGRFNWSTQCSHPIGTWSENGYFGNTSASHPLHQMLREITEETNLKHGFTRDGSR